MKLLQFTATEQQVDEVLQPLALLSKSDAVFMRVAIKSNLNYLLREMRVYVVDAINYDFDTLPDTWKEEVFMSEAEIQGTVYTLEGFQHAHNNSEIDLADCYIRFINTYL